jgi:dipeptidase D
VYKKMYGNEPEVKAIHAGLECGILGGAYPNWDMISCGPNIRSPHSPDERTEIVTVEKWWNYVVGVLKEAPAKK